jgi:hypothetical protein
MGTLRMPAAHSLERRHNAATAARFQIDVGVVLLCRTPTQQLVGNNLHYEIFLGEGSYVRPPGAGSWGHNATARGSRFSCFHFQGIAFWLG